MDSCHAAWVLGQRFKFLHHKSDTFAHRIYWGPPDGTRRKHIKPTEVFVDFGAEYMVTALYIGKEFSAVQFQVEPAVLVWTNIRRRYADGYTDWWAAISEAQPYGPGMPQCLEEGRAPVRGEPVKTNTGGTEQHGVLGNEEQDVDDKAPVNEDPGVPVNEERDGDAKAPVNEDLGITGAEEQDSKRQRCD